MLPHAEKFFDYAKERHAVYLRRTAGLPRPWTADEIMQRYRFTNVYRELDKTTVWFRENVRDRLRSKSEVLLATVVFRLLNRIETGEAVFLQPSLYGNRTAFEQFLETGKESILARSIRQFVGKRGPYVTGAYIISSPPGYSKLDGVVKALGDFNRNSEWRSFADGMRREECTLEAAWEWLREQPWLGTFHSYEIVTDLRHTDLLCDAGDVMTWANVGPGARRGMNRVAGREKDDRSVSAAKIVIEMQELLKISRLRRYWPSDWPAWEMREVEHTLCEFDKMERTRLGEGRPRGVFN